MKTHLSRSLVARGALAVSLLVASEASATTAPNSASYDEVDAYVQGQMDHLRIPGASLAIVEGDELVHLRGFGLAEPGGAAPSPQTPFFIRVAHEIDHRPGGDAAR
jgi:CubicO group peptidase (beta-lactamase class C family)